MPYHALLPVRDEADIIGQCLETLLAWVDFIYVFDTGSVDNTWEIVQAYASCDKRIKPLRQDAVFYSECKLRGWLFHQARQNMRDGDWFLRVDADEFHHIPPPEFVKTRLRSHETIVWHQYYDFCLLESEVADWEAGRETFSDRGRPIEDRRHWYIPSIYSEPRLCRYRDTMKWPPTVSFPYNAGYVARERLPIRHYPHRDPVQLELRCRLRAVMMADEQNRKEWKRAELHHWAEREWRKFITPDATAGLNHWIRGQELQMPGYTNHLARFPKRALQRIIHATLLGALDRQRPAWPPTAYPQQIPSDLVSKLQLELTYSADRLAEQTTSYQP